MRFCYKKGITSCKKLADQRFEVADKIIAADFGTQLLEQEVDIHNVAIKREYWKQFKVNQKHHDKLPETSNVMLKVTAYN